MAISKIKGSAIQDATIPEDKLEDEAGSFRMILDGSDGSATDAGDFLLLDATASSTNVGEQFLFEPATDDGSAIMSTFFAGGGTKVSVSSEGGTVFTDVQQGLAKAWLNLIGTGTIAILDSFNISGITDGGTGLYNSGFFANMSNNDYSATAAGGESDDSGGNRSVGLRARATTGCNLRGFHDGSSATDLADICVTMHGDLA
tara:strand:+ start:657 stop:1262 length:606 start_codon:yes stop_codon:yes gene_type:complete